MDTTNHGQDHMRKKQIPNSGFVVAYAGGSIDVRSGTCQVVPFHETAELPLRSQRDPLAQRQVEVRQHCRCARTGIEGVADVVRDAV